jgi:hypothetical protein
LKLRAEDGKMRETDVAYPESGIERLMETYLRKGNNKEWINQRGDWDHRKQSLININT